MVAGASLAYSLITPYWWSEFKYHFTVVVWRAWNFNDHIIQILHRRFLKNEPSYKKQNTGPKVKREKNTWEHARRVVTPRGWDYESSSSPSCRRNPLRIRSVFLDIFHAEQKIIIMRKKNNNLPSDVNQNERLKKRFLTNLARRRPAFPLQRSRHIAIGPVSEWAFRRALLTSYLGCDCRELEEIATSWKQLGTIHEHASRKLRNSIGRFGKSE